MKTLPSLTAVVLACAVLTATPSALRAAEGAPTVTLSALLEEMIDREAAARLPAPPYALAQASSYDRAGNDPGNLEAWHANGDHGQFIHTEVNEGRREWLIMEDDGPGAIVRFWTPLFDKKEDMTIRFYFDDAPTPAITAKMNDLFRGCDFVPPPFAFVSWNETDLRHQVETPRKDAAGVGGDLYLPIPYATHCKITLDRVPFYYVINYRRYRPGTRVTTFSDTEYAAARPALERIGKALLAETPSDTTPPALTREAILAPGHDLSITLPRGPAALRDLRVKLDPARTPQALRSVIVQAMFDDEDAVWCPVGDFFGAGVRLNPVHDWWRTVNDDGTLEARWVMPYEHSAQLTLRNVGPEPVPVTCGARTVPWQWDDRSLHFHATWHATRAMPTRPKSDWNYVEITGQGRYAGDTLTVFSPHRAWYGEGDEFIYIDGATFPQHIGTGTEDYYGYAWGMATFFNSPFLSTPQRDTPDRGNWTGYTTTSRLRPLDAIPFRTALKVDMEIWNWADTQMDYAATAFWYARPGAAHNRPPQPEEAAAPVREGSGSAKIPGAVECETARVTAHSPGLRVSTQDAGLHEGEWSGGRQLFVQATNVGDFVELTIPIPGGAAKARRMTLYGTKSYDYGILRVSINGRSVAPEIDTYGATPAPTGPVELGTFTPKDEAFLVRVEVVGTNPASKPPHYYFGLDCIVAAPGD